MRLLNVQARLSSHSFHARTRGQNVHGCFLRSKDFLLKNGAIQRNVTQTQTDRNAYIGNDVQAGENTCKNSVLNP